MGSRRTVLLGQKSPPRSTSHHFVPIDQKTLQGQHRCAPPSSVKYPLIQRIQEQRRSPESLWPSNIIHSLRFNTSITTAQFYSERYEAYREADDLTLRDWLLAHMGTVDEAKLRKTTEILGVEKLLNGSLMNLSNGQQRRARIVKALLQDPEILLLDEPYSHHIPLDVADQCSGTRRGLPKDVVKTAGEPRPDSVSTYFAFPP